MSRLHRARAAVLACAALGALFPLHADAAQRSPARVPTAAVAATSPAVQNTLRALDRLASFGYTVGTEARADRAIRAWQKANGLVVDGIVGPQTLRSLDLGPSATATVSAVRVSPPVPEPGNGTVESIIRDVWPDDIEDEAVRIATRESRLVPTAANACCYGLMQIHFRAHRAWLTTLGITSPEQLLDARTNAEVGYQLYLIDGWNPWRL